MSPVNLILSTIAAVLLGGATLKKASITNVIIGAFLFQGIVTVGPMVTGSALGEITEALRLVIQNALVLYALTRK